ncbi:UDP-N-acetylmuramoyl-L-alanyl-D-glutamate--2,6-diaminopimelate ligase [Psychromonas sp. psych-6C06]|uniref:UDP-N-acetylmuramoyl-L-alanyl-D-glutamate--2, 6-diaminopimelate ligase n=1 Tax=Psychromonas sp. psych-6C06 TaxID=2058089 RepID=UPI000C33BA66|nr:UDP-N-acetylmuramoyl-L-alanyl-D-glutamate--2,6-diaminopimelate ligase [Psychromonas sp. psych-6C06]PKF62240.1 UDP-N-acetylmuramoyl-L-alanyl-D-glutamate--2,6-diaminopimelate ligase [Psychromonas sp. psych-6C06]
MPNKIAHPLNLLLSPWLSLPNTISMPVAGMTLDSRKVKNNYLFVALQGGTVDGRLFIENAIQGGACVVLAETKDKQQHGMIESNNETPIIHFYDLTKVLSKLAYQFYFPDADCHKVIGVTGTNGKTTIATLLANCLTLLNQKSAQMGTIGNGLFGELVSSLNTTLDPLSVFACLNDYQWQGTKYTMMEVSSHGLVQERVSAVPFHSAIFTNLTRDHLDYHGTMQAYGDAKKKLFEDFPLKHRIINLDDKTGATWVDEYPDAITFSTHNKRLLSHRYLMTHRVRYLAQGLAFCFESSWGNGEIVAPFYGDFNVSNLAAVITQLLADEFTIHAVQQVMPLLSTVAGRMEQYHFEPQNSTFVVDYAHTPDALEKALLALKKHSHRGRLICVFGCGGDRDKGKRTEMAKVAEAFADKVVLVDDNPRTESAEQIMSDILVGFTQPDRVECIHDRKQAIEQLLATSQEDDLILVAGKGHEDYQIIGDKRIDYSDRVLLASLQLLHKKKTDL